METVLIDTALLFFLGICGWGLFTLLRMPVAPVFGTLTLIGVLRVAGYELPPPPGFIFPGVQIMLGYFVGAKITRETVGEIRFMVLPAAVIVIWSLSLVFIIGTLLSLTSTLDLYTSFLSCSIGGLPEMTIIALASGADVTVLVIMQSIRMVATVVFFPLIIRRWLGSGAGDSETAGSGNGGMLLLRYLPWLNHPFAWIGESLRNGLAGLREDPKSFLSQGGGALLTVALAVVGGSILMGLGVPAGGMLGAMLAVASLSLAGFPVKALPSGLFNYMLVAVGIMVSGNLSPETMEVLASGGLFVPVAAVTLITFITALGVAYIIHKLVGWDYPTCFLAAAPAGFTIMTTLAIKYDRDPFRVSLLHLCRLVALKTVVPLVFMFLI